MRGQATLAHPCEVDPGRDSGTGALGAIWGTALLLSGMLISTAEIEAQGIEVPLGMPHYPAFACPTASGNLRDSSPEEMDDESRSSRQIEEGRKRFKAGDYRGALDAFRAAVIADTEGGLAQAYFALGLILVGDGRNSDKALRSAAEAKFVGPLDVKGMWKDEKERIRVTEVLGRIVGDGELTAAWILFLLGEPESLKRLAVKDAIARKLLRP